MANSYNSDILFSDADAFSDAAFTCFVTDANFFISSFDFVSELFMLKLFR